jgi:hypothetical protein
MFSNIWNHPKTSIAGLLIGIATIAGVLTGQGITLGKAGTGTIVTLISGLATALLGLLAKDPDSISIPPSSGPQKLGALMLCALLVSGLFATGCSPANIAQDIVNWTPALDAAASTVATIDPLFLPEAAAFIAISQAVDAQAKAYLANPGASVLAKLQAAIVTAQQQVNASLLNTVRIVDPATQKHVLAALQSYGAIVNALLALVAQVSTKAAVAQMAAQSTIKLAQVDTRDYRRVARCVIASHFDIGLYEAEAVVVGTDRDLERAGF